MKNFSEKFEANIREQVESLQAIDRKFLVIITITRGVTRVGHVGHLPGAPGFRGRQIEIKIYTRYSEVVFTTKKKVMKLRKRTIFLKKEAQIFSFARGAGDPSYAPGNPSFISSKKNSDDYFFS